MPYLLDTDWALNVLKGRNPVVGMIDRLMGSGVSISRITVAELYEGAYHTVDPDASLASLRQFLGGYRVRELTDPVARHFAELRAHLRRRGELVPDLDLLIAATALRHDLTLLTFNRRHFVRVPGLRVWEPR